ncbi:MAG: aromatic-L-amino-acid/L-tryptophan decarboxylase, partial [Gemmatimonadaceae bacterium]|nr:aromatic-L-amino-acid/L-tryptophan decarboxylase [Gemmatimonadaceae bacterium]
RLAKLLAQWIDDDPTFERLAEVRFSTVVFRYVSPGMTADQLNDHNARLLETVNATREVYLSHTKVGGRYAFRLAIGNIHTAEAHVRHAFDLVREAGRLK